MNKATLLRTRTVMDLCYAAVRKGLGSATFERLDEDGQRRVVELESDAWEDMGRPHTITVTIEPGDRLNEDQ